MTTKPTTIFTAIPPPAAGAADIAIGFGAAGMVCIGAGAGFGAADGPGRFADSYMSTMTGFGCAIVPGIDGIAAIGFGATEAAGITPGILGIGGFGGTAAGGGTGFGSSNIRC
jgi:hypothetical protein